MPRIVLLDEYLTTALRSPHEIAIEWLESGQTALKSYKCDGWIGDENAFCNGGGRSRQTRKNLRWTQ